MLRKCENLEIVRIIGKICGIRGHGYACVCIGIAVRAFCEVAVSCFQSNRRITMNATCNLHTSSKIGNITYAVPE